MVRFDRSTSQRGAKYVEDRRGQRPRGGARMGGGKAVGGIGGLIMLLIAAFFGINLGGGGSSLGIDAGTDLSGGAVGSGGVTTVVDPQADTVDYMQALMFDVQETWDIYFDQAGQSYEYTTLVIYEDVVDTGCGRATSAVGPFYCPAPGDNKVYIDLSFWNQLSSQFGAPGDFAQAYVVAHEIGHHIQSVTGISDAVRTAQANDPSNKNAYSVRQELQADCLAGVWAFSANQRVTRDTGQPIIQRGDIEEGLAAAAAVGDDRIQAQAGMTVDPHTWTHGSSQQRIDWFLEGYDNGDPELCDPFERGIDL